MKKFLKGFLSIFKLLELIPAFMIWGLIELYDFLRSDMMATFAKRTLGLIIVGSYIGALIHGGTSLNVMIGMTVFLIVSMFVAYAAIMKPTK